MRKISLIAFAVLAAASTSAYAAPNRGLTLASADAAPAVQSTAPAVQRRCQSAMVPCAVPGTSTPAHRIGAGSGSSMA